MRDGAAKSRMFVQPDRLPGRGSRVARQEQTVVADQRKLLTFCVSQGGEEMEKIARQDRDFQNAHEGAVMDEPLAHREERLPADTRLVHLAVISSDIAMQMGTKKVAVGGAGIGRDIVPRGDERPSVSVVDPDRLNQRNLGVELFQ